jgi:hypothetical protein
MKSENKRRKEEEKKKKKEKKEKWRKIEQKRLFYFFPYLHQGPQFDHVSREVQ